MESPDPVQTLPGSTPVAIPAEPETEATVHDLDRAPADPRRAVEACPFLIAETGDWRLSAPAREHRCAALLPLASLTFEKQARLCLTSAHTSCATYVAALAAREARTGVADLPERAGRWAFAFTTPLIEDVGGVRARVGGLLADRRTWPAIPVIVLVASLFALAISGVRNDRPVTALASPPATPVGSSTASAATIAPPSPTPSPTGSPVISPISTARATPIATVGPSPTPAFRATYRVQSGDTLSGIAAKFHTTVSAIEKLNGITDPSRLKIGQILRIP